MEQTGSFTQEIKEELCQNYVDVDDEILISLLSGFVKNNGVFSIKNKETSLVLEIENAKVIKFIYTSLKRLFPDSTISFSYRKMMKLNKSTRYILTISNSQEVLDTLKITFFDQKINYHLVSKELKIKAYLAGLFLSSGSCNNPISSNYHLEIALKNSDYAKEIMKVISRIKVSSFNFKETERRQNFVLYLKKSDQISMFLAFIEANQSCLKFEGVRLDRDFANVSNRLLNCDTYNYNKTIANSEKQIELIKFIDKTYGIKNLNNEKMQLLCKLRLENPEANYSELAEEMSAYYDNKISKSSVNHLFRALKELAIKLNYEEK